MTMQFIASATIGAGGAANFTFQNIPSTFTHLQLRIFARTSEAVVTGESYFWFNGQNTNFNAHQLIGNGSTASGGGNQYSSLMYAATSVGANATSNVFSNVICDVLDYANTNKNKVIRVLSGVDNNGSGAVMLGSGLWINTSAITELAYRGNANFVQGSRADLYGITTSALTGA